jgi:hypothetical protein
MARGRAQAEQRHNWISLQNNPAEAGLRTTWSRRALAAPEGLA